MAAIKGDIDGVKKLLDQGMSPNVADFAGMSTTTTTTLSHVQHHAFLSEQAGRRCTRRATTTTTMWR